MGERGCVPAVFRVLCRRARRRRVRQKMIARLGEDAGDILDEFMSFCLARKGRPARPGSLPRNARTAGPEIKREMDQTRDEVRIMTVHAAKGMEAPVVFLVDGGSAPFSAQHLPRLMPFERRARAGGKRLSLARGRPTSPTPSRRRSAAELKRARRGRIPPPALCRHDPRRGPADRLRLSRQAPAAARHLAFDRQRGAARRAESTRAPPSGERRGCNASASPGCAGRGRRRQPRPPAGPAPRRQICSTPLPPTKSCRARWRRPAPRC